MVHTPPVKWYTISLLWNSSGRKKSSLLGKALWKVVINQEERKESILMWHSQSTKAKTSPYNIKSYPGPIPWSVKGRKKQLQVSAFVFFPQGLWNATVQNYRWVMWRHCGACLWSQLNSEANRSFCWRPFELFCPQFYPIQLRLWIYFWTVDEKTLL